MVICQTWYKAIGRFFLDFYSNTTTPHPRCGAKIACYVPSVWLHQIVIHVACGCAE